ncbi:uncharacterized protein LOC101462939 [Ceratitis capitata]|uniref:uncharacterized protein LOC101462939 n=1 Tax=Ceratitis capitata TaxID=7213 RepID=UPI0006189691|nr:uncharacterized protein LOC101462939 [Ceratitis capitata]
MDKNYDTILLTGPPGVGKTTLVKKICDELRMSHKVYGFITEEVRSEQAFTRIGFDVVTLSGARCILAREQSRMNDRMPIVGKYSVNVSDFENLIVPLLCPKSKKDLLVIDEIGTMELKSKRFEKALNDVIHKTPIFATIPCHSHRKNTILEHIKSSPATRIFEITKNNRNIVQNDIVNCIKNMLRKN